MKARSLKIHNFRSIRDLEVEIASYALVVGPNNAGKSNMFAALRVFYEKGLKYDYARDFPKFETDDQESWIEVEYAPSAEELKDLKDEYRLGSNTFRVRKYLASQETDDEGKRRTGIYAYVDGRLSNARFYGAKNVQQGKLGDIIYIPAVSKLDENTKLSGPSPLRDLISVVLKGVLEASPSYHTLLEAFQEFGIKLKQECTSEGLSLEQLETDISDQLANWGLNFEFLVNSVAPDDVIKSLIAPQILDEHLGHAFDPSAFGAGFQRQLIFSLIRLASNYGTKPPAKRKKEFSPDLTWILFEEPEAFLHPSQIKFLNQNLSAFARDPTQQVMVCSHSPHFASQNIEELPAIIRLNREAAITVAGQIRESDLGGFLAANLECVEELRQVGIPVDEDDLTVDMESIKYVLWLSPVRTEAFFAEQVLLVEGPSETALANLLINEGRICPKRPGLVVVDTLGKWNTHRFVNLLGALRIPHAVLYDRDGGKPSSIALEKVLLAAKNSFTRKIDSFDIDLEEFLDVPPTRPNRKPQHLLWRLRNGMIETSRVDSFCHKVQQLIDA